MTRRIVVYNPALIPQELLDEIVQQLDDDDVDDED